MLPPGVGAVWYLQQLDPRRRNQLMTFHFSSSNSKMPAKPPPSSSSSSKIAKSEKPTKPPPSSSSSSEIAKSEKPTKPPSSPSFKMSIIRDKLFSCIGNNNVNGSSSENIPTKPSNPSTTTPSPPPPPLPLPLTSSSSSKLISVGSKLPDATLSFLNSADIIKTVTISDLTSSKNVILFAVPGAFVPPASSPKQELGLSVKLLKSRGIDTVACVSVNDVYVMKAWKKTINHSDGIGGEEEDEEGLLYLSDVDGGFTSAIGADVDLRGQPQGLGVRSKRYCMLVQDGFVRVLEMIDDGGLFASPSDMLHVF